MIRWLSLKRVFINILLLVVGLSVLLLSLEFISRLTSKNYQVRSRMTKYYQRDKTRGNILRPNSKGVWMRENYFTTISINSLGFRDGERKLEKAPNTYRIIVMGDSFTFGLGVNIEDTYTKKLENLLNAHSADTKYEVFNMAVPGDGPDQEYLFLKENGWKFQPDLVIVGFCPNDIVDLFRFVWVEDEKGLPERIIFTLQAPDWPFRRFLQEHSYFYNFIAYRVSKLRNKLKTKAMVSESQVAPAIKSFYQQPYSPALTEQLNNVFLMYKEMDEMAKDRKTKFMTLLLPYECLTVKDYFVEAAGKELGERIFRDAYPLSLVEQYCRKMGISVLSTLPTFRKQDNPRKLFIDKDGHFSPQGHLLVAQLLYSYLREEDK